MFSNLDAVIVWLPVVAVFLVALIPLFRRYKIRSDIKKRREAVEHSKGR